MYLGISSRRRTLSGTCARKDPCFVLICTLCSFVLLSPYSFLFPCANCWVCVAIFFAAGLQLPLCCTSFCNSFCTSFLQLFLLTFFNLHATLSQYFTNFNGSISMALYFKQTGSQYFTNSQYFALDCSQYFTNGSMALYFKQTVLLAILYKFQWVNGSLF